MELLEEQKPYKTLEGYKKTDVGMLPNDWVVEKLGSISSIKTGPFGSSLHEKDYVSDGIPIITVEHLGELGIVHKNMPMVSDSDRKRLNAYALLTHDIVFSRVGSVDRNSLVTEKEEGWLFSGRLLRIRLNSKSVSSKYLSYYLHYEPTRQRIRSVAVGQTMASLNTQILKEFEVAFPPTIEEQNTIASALSNVDEVISNLDKLIAKKKAIKQGAMQQLLKSPKHGGKRLPGFEGEWKETTLGEVVDFLDGRRKPIKSGDRARMKGIYPYYGASGIIDYVNAYLFDDELILLGEDGENILSRNVRLAFKVSGKIWVNNHAHVLKPKYGYDVDFLTEYLESLDYELYNSGSAQPKLNKKTCSHIPLTIPPSLAEQKQISSILSDMDAEIENLEKKKVKYQSIKQGMMQELLTGKIRLV